jgi:hypothetical protein
MFKKYLFQGILFILIQSCNFSSTEKDRCNNSVFNSSLSIEIKENEHEISNPVDYLGLLDCSKDSDFFEVVNNKYKLQPFDYNGLKGYVPQPSFSTDKFANYLAYRYAEYVDDLDKNSLLKILISGHLRSNAKKDTAECLEKVFEIENLYLSYYLENDSLNKSIKEFENYLKAFPDSKRIQYLWAKLNFDFGSVQIGLKLFKELLDKEYYQKPILKLIINYYSNTNQDSLRKYADYFKQQYPYECNLGEISLFFDSTISQRFLNDCKKCFNGLSRKDSMSAKIFLCRKYLITKNYTMVNRMFNDYKSNNEEFVLNKFKIFEAGEYFDIILQSYFLQKRYNEMYKFITKDMGYNKKIVVKSAGDFYRLLLGYYKMHINANVSSDEFDAFFRKIYYSLPKSAFKKA